MNLNLQNHYLATFVTIGLLTSSQAQLVHQWTFDVDGSSTVGEIDMDFSANASVSTSCSKVGDGAVRVSSANAPALGGATSQDPIDWDSFANGDTRTIAFWVRPEIVQEGQATWFGAGQNAGGQRFDIKSSGANFRVEVEGGGQTTSSQINDATWHHVAVVAPLATSTMADLLFYVDGAEVANANTQTRTIITADRIIRIGDSSNGAANRDFDGLVDDVRIYESALTLAEIQTLATSGRAIGCFEAAAETLILGNDIDLEWEADDDVTSLIITNDQDATSIDALAIGALGSTPVAPTTTTTYTITSGGTADSRQFTINVQTSPDVNSFTSSPELTFASGDIALNWTTDSAGWLEITDDQGSAPIVFTTTIDTQAFLDTGTVTIPNVSTTTVYTLTATLAQDGTGETTTLQTTATVQSAPDLTLVAAPSISNATTNVTLFFNATVIESITEVTSGIIEGFGAANGLTDNQVQDNDVTDFATLLTAGPYVFEIIDGDIIGMRYDITGFSGNVLEVDGTPALDGTVWQSYRIIETSFTGADTLSIRDDLDNVLFTTTDPAEIANGSITIPNVSADTTFTASATITGFGTAQDDATFTITGDGSSYEEVILSNSPIAYYRFEESFGSTVVYDSSGNEVHTVTIDNPEFFTSGSPGILGNGGLFDEPETTGAALVTGLSFDPSASSWSVTALARPDELFDNGANIIANRDGPSAGTGRSQLFISGADASLDSFQNTGAIPTDDSAVNINTPYIENASCHVAITYDMPSTTLSIYLDGNLDGQVIVTPDAADGAWVIGAQKVNQANTFWDGILDEVAFFDTALTPTDVAAQNTAFLNNSGAGILAFGRDTEIFFGETTNLFVKVGAGSISATIDNGVGSVAIGASSSPPVSPTETTTYTLTVDGQPPQTVTITVLPPETVTITDCGLDANGDFFIEIAEGVTGFKVTTSPDLATAFADATGVSDDGANRFLIDSDSLDSNADGSDFFRVETE